MTSMQFTNLDEPPSQDRISGPALARWCSLTAGGEAQIDADKIVNLETTSDSTVTKTQLDNLVQGEAVNSTIWPLIFNGLWTPDEGALKSLATLRSLSFLRGLVETSEQVPNRFEGLTKEQKRHVALGVRDLYLAAWRSLLDDKEQQLLVEVTQTLSSPLEPQVLKGAMPVSFHPSANHKMLKFVVDLDLQIPDESLRPYFAQVMSTPRLFAVFVDPADLSYHNFENIVPLDAWFRTKTLSDNAGEAVLPAAFTSLQQVQDDAQVWTGKLALDSEANNILRQLADLDLYVPPLNSGTRGGERFIFNSSILSRSLTTAVQQSEILNKIADAAASTCPADSFRFINYVFRCNKFAPGTGKFTQHRDTPYYDAARSQISKYTLLLYLSPGTARSTRTTASPAENTDEPALRINTGSENPDQSDVCFHDIESMQFVIFDQRLEHEGYPFVDTDKIFLRTELIFEEPRLRVPWLRRHALEHHDNAVAGLFSEACYMSGHGIFDAELAAHAHRCYEKVNAMHWGLVGGADGKQDDKDYKGVYLLKRFVGLRFLTNGYDYWFAVDGVAHSPSSDRKCVAQASDIKDCATIALLDHCNVHVSGGKPFRSLLETSNIHESIRSDQDIIRLLGQNSTSHAKESRGLRHLTQPDVDAVFPKQDDEKPFIKRKFSWKTNPDYDNDEQDCVCSRGTGCCPCHRYETFDARDSQEVHEAYEVCCAYTRRKILGAPITLLGAEEEIVINHDNVLVEGDKVYFLRPLPTKKTGGDGDGVEEGRQGGWDERRINFAACWTGQPNVTDFIGLAGQIKAMHFLVPPSQFRELVPDATNTRAEGGGMKYYHFTMDLFRNDWVVHVNDDVKIPVPAITNDLHDEEDTSGGRSAFLRQTPGYEYYISNGLEIHSDGEPNETL